MLEITGILCNVSRYTVDMFRWIYIIVSKFTNKTQRLLQNCTLFYCLEYTSSRTSFQSYHYHSNNETGKNFPVDTVDKTNYLLTIICILFYKECIFLISSNDLFEKNNPFVMLLMNKMFLEQYNI